MINFNRPTIEDVDALCGIDTLPPGRFEIAVQMGKKTNMKKGDRVLVIHGTKGNQADVYSSEFEVDIVEIALNSEESDTSENDFPLDIKENSFDIVTNEGYLCNCPNYKEILSKMTKVCKKTVC